VFGADERSALVSKAASYCAKLLRRTDQCQAVLACSHLYWQPEVEVGDGFNGALSLTWVLLRSLEP
jgi:vacuolar protein sorting-associated protein 35